MAVAVLAASCGGNAAGPHSQRESCLHAAIGGGAGAGLRSAAVMARTPKVAGVMCSTADTAVMTDGEEDVGDW